MNLLQRFIGFISQPDHKRTFSILAALAILAAIPLTVYVAQQQQDIRQRAEGPPCESGGGIEKEERLCRARFIFINYYCKDGGLAGRWTNEPCGDQPSPPPPTSTPTPGGSGGNYCAAAGFHECNPGTSTGSCTKDGKTCRAYEVYTCNFGGKNYCGSTSCAEPCTTGGGTQPPPGGGGIGNDGPGGCCNPSAPNDGSGDNCRSWERCDISNGACSTGKSCRSTTGCARDSDCGPGNRCQGGSCQPGPSTGQCQSASSLQARFQLNSSDPWGQTKQVRASTPVNAAVFRNSTGQLAGSSVNNEYTPTDVSGRISGPTSQSIDVSRVNQFTPTQAGTYSLTATCGNNVTATATLTVTGSACTANYALNPQPPVNPNTQISAHVTAQSPNVACVVLYQDGVQQDCRISPSGGYDCTLNSGNSGTRDLQLKFGQSDKYPAGTACGSQRVDCNTYTYNVGAQFNAADVNRDGCISLLDFNEWLYAFKNNGTPRNPNHRPDINGDTRVDIIDFNLWLRALQSGQNLCQ